MFCLLSNDFWKHVDERSIKMHLGKNNFKLKSKIDSSEVSENTSIYDAGKSPQMISCY